ncbi:MAG: SpoIIE family protein phosphatase [Microscillaceae bacterium]|nr:SpoIIE family protein phosphatase [Microscillaceae bacterium]
MIKHEDDDLLFSNEDLEDDDLLFMEEDEHASSTIENSEKWKILIVDDEEEIHTVTRFALSDYEYKSKKLLFLDAYTGEEAIQTLLENQDVALVLLDVVMESNDAGLKVVERIRHEIKNEFIRIIMRTGQPGQAPEDEVIIKYDINDYKNKTELTDKKLFTTITTGLRSYADIMEIESYRQNLELKVIERTAEVVKAKEIIEKKNHDITSSITYAKRIQEAMLPHIENIQAIIPELFVLFLPRDIVSGDFYWFAEKNGKILIAAIDCTGHGVPGAFMSMVGDAYLNQIVKSEGITSPDLILNHLHERIRQALKQEETQNRDGMDMVICSLDLEQRVLEVAGAKNPLVLIQNNRVYQIKGDRNPIGGEQKETKRVFAKHRISLDQPTWFYLFSDGFQDQFGGPEGKKFMVKKLRELFLEIHQKPFTEQHAILEQIFEDWKGADNKQTDDVLIVGFKI